MTKPTSNTALMTSLWALVMTQVLSVNNHLQFDSSASVGSGMLAINSQMNRTRLTPVLRKEALKVAYLVFVTGIGTDGWQDALDVLAFSIKKAAAKSRHKIELLALSPETLSSDKKDRLLKAGFKDVLKRTVPVPPHSMSEGMAREHMTRVMGHSSSHNEFLMAHETIKYWGLTLRQYDRVLVLDADTMVLDPMDELMERGEDFIGTYDHGLDIKGSAMPPTQGGFLLFKPSPEDFEAIKGLTQRGEWDSGGWKNSGIGWCYGGVGPDGLLPYYFNQHALMHIRKFGKEQLPEGIAKPKVNGSRMLAVDRSVYDVVLNQRLRSEVDAFEKDPEELLSNVKSVHFTGDCVKPWDCSYAKHWLCEGLFNKWWALRGELEASRGLSKTRREDNCKSGHYMPISHAG
jgi:hypothetical protein